MNENGDVAPHAGAGIETWVSYLQDAARAAVAPHAGAWIETQGVKG